MYGYPGEPAGAQYSAASSLSGGAIFGIIIAVLVVIAVIGTVIAYRVSPQAKVKISQVGLSIQSR